MKCLVLAGGTGDRLWPLSRKNYPKQFMEIMKGRSMFQETILRNIPFCDEFIIITNKRHESIVKGQLQDFQDLKYSILMEDTPLKTAPSIVTLALNFDGDEEFLIASTDNVIEGEYNSCITSLKDCIRRNKIGVVVCEHPGKPTSNHYVEYSSGKIKFTTTWNKSSFIDCGIMGAKVSVLLSSIDPNMLEECKKHISVSGNMFVEDVNEPVKHISYADIIKTDNVELIKSKFACSRITDISSYYGFIGNKDDKNDNIIEVNCKDVKIINSSSDRIVVANDLRNIIIANTKDAVYVTRTDSKSGIKELLSSINSGNKSYFEEYPFFYHEWGVTENINKTEDYTISKITLYPNSVLSDCSERGIFVNYYIIDGSVELKIKNKEPQIFKANENIEFHTTTVYEILNKTKKSITLLKTENKKIACVKSSDGQNSSGLFVKLKPSLKDFIWGGSKIKEVLGKNVGKHEKIAESWELSAHKAGQSKIANGKFKGLTLSKYIETIGKENLGWKAQDYERFPILVKFIDAKENLSVQVHPDDEYAFPHEGDYGKNEMWYVMEAEKNACIYLGFSKDMTKEEICKHIKDNTLLNVMNKIPVKKGDTYFLKAGTVHAIGSGCLICEIQQSSNVTYRLYDYGRVGYKGKPRTLNIDKALEVADLKKVEDLKSSKFSVFEFQGYKRKLLGQCKYFVAMKYDITGELTLASTGSSFKTIVVIEGSGKIGNGQTNCNTVKGDTWFFGSKESIVIKGNMTVILVNI